MRKFYRHSFQLVLLRKRRYLCHLFCHFYVILYLQVRYPIWHFLKLKFLPSRELKLVTLREYLLFSSRRVLYKHLFVEKEIDGEENHFLCAYYLRFSDWPKEKETMASVDFTKDVTNGTFGENGHKQNGDAAVSKDKVNVQLDF